MKHSVTIASDQWEKADIMALLQSIRNCEMEHFPDKLISVSVGVPDLSTEDVMDLITGVDPPFKHGPMIFRRDRG